MEKANINKFWSIEGKYNIDDHYWGASNNIYDKEIANSIYSELKNKYKITRMISHIESFEVVKEYIKE